VPTEEQLREIHRLALLGGETAIAQDVTSRLAGAWLQVSRFRAVRDLCRQTLQLGPAPDPLTYLARALRVLGGGLEALRLYREALQMYDEAGDRAGLATTLTNIGVVYDGLGQRTEALAYYEKALPLREEVGDRAGESVTRYNIAMLYRAQGQLREAVHELQQVVAIDEQVHSPNLEADRAMLAQVEAELGANPTHM